LKKAAPPPAYALEDDIEHAVVLASCSEPRFHQAIGKAIDPERLRDASAKLLVAAAHAVAAKTGRAPAWSAIPIQHLATLMSQGKVTLDQLNGAKDYLLDAMSLPSVTVDDLISSVVPIIQRVLHKEAIVGALDGYKNNASPSDTAAAFDAVARLGKSAGSTTALIQSIVSDPDFFSAVPADMLRFGIPELDDALGGGLEREALGLIVGGTGAGKSMALAHFAVEAMLCGHHVLYVTLELSPVRVTQRIVRNLIDMTKREAQIDPALARHRFAKVMAMPGMGRIVVVEAPALVTNPRDIRTLSEQAMRSHPGFDPKVFVTDFMDKLRCNPKASLYDDMLAVADGLRSIATDADGWSLTASQSDRKSTGRPWLDLDAIADSMNKVRSADLVVAIGRTEEDQTTGQIRFSVPKRREGEGAYTRIGPIAWDPDHGRITVVSDRVYPW
jgi:hypothetical protein